jgi:hypothetical protein
MFHLFLSSLVSYLLLFLLLFTESNEYATIIWTLYMSPYSAKIASFATVPISTFNSLSNFFSFRPTHAPLLFFQSQPIIWHVSLSEKTSHTSWDGKGKHSSYLPLDPQKHASLFLQSACLPKHSQVSIPVLHPARVVVTNKCLIIWAHKHCALIRMNCIHKLSLHF